MSWRSAAAMSGLTGPPASTKKLAPPGSPTRYVFDRNWGCMARPMTIAAEHWQMGCAASVRASPDLVPTCDRIGDIDRSVAFYEALDFEELRRMPNRDEAINVFMGL